MQGRGQFIGAILLFAAMGTGSAHAAQLSPPEETPEIMMEVQGLCGAWLGLQFGASEDLSFISNTNIANKTFSYAAVPASTYAGQPLVLNASGAYDGNAAQWNYSVIGSVGASNWTMTGTAVDPPFIEHFENDFVPSPFETIISDVTYTQTATRTVSQGTFTVKYLGVVVSTTTHFDTLELQGADAGKWIWDTDVIHTGVGDVRVGSAGYSPPAGGMGQFTTAIAVPEPADAALVTAIATCCAAARRAGKQPGSRSGVP